MIASPAKIAKEISTPTCCSQDCVKARDIAQIHLDAVRKKVIELKALEQSLINFVAECNDVCAGGSGRDCVIFKELAMPS